MSGVILEPVVRSRDFRRFIAVPAYLHRGLANAVTPLAHDLRRAIDPGLSSFLRDNPSARWVALRDGEPVGRIMAIHDNGYLAKHRDGVGHFGFIEFTDDQEVVDTLLAAAVRWLKGRGLTRMRGPFSPSINHETGLLVDGFATPPTYLMNYAPPYYSARLERAGLRGVMDLYSFTTSTNPRSHPEPTLRLMERAEQIPGLQVRPLDLHNYRRDIALLVDIYNDGWSGNWGAVPISDTEAQELGRMLRPLISPEWLLFAHYQGEPIGVSLQMPDLNAAISDFGGRLLPFNWAKLLYRMRRPTVSHSRLLMLGIRKSWHGNVIGPMAAMSLLAAGLKAANTHGIKTAELGWVLETNKAILSVIGKFSISERKTYRIFERPL